MADISALGVLEPAAPLDLNQYKSATGFQMPKAGRYTLRSRDSFDATAFSRTRAGQLQADIAPTIVGPTNEGQQIRFCKVSAKTFERSGQQVSYIGDYLKACGVTGEVPADPQEIANLVESTAGRVFEADLDWEANHYPTGFQVKGMRNFPSDGNGGFQSWVTHPTEKDADGSPLRLRANLTIRRYINND